MQYDELQRVYGREEYYWGTEPNELAEQVVAFAPDRDRPRVVDVGAGEGRDAVYLAERGCDVLAVDVAPNGLAKAERLADERNVEIETRQADVNDLSLPPVDAVYSIGTLQYLRPENRAARFDQFEEATTPGGVHVLFAFVDHPDIPPAPDWGEEEHFYRRGELRSYYDDWELLAEDALVFDDESGGEPHRHAAETLVARKPADE